MMKQTHDERAVRGANALGAKLYLWALGLLGLLAVLKLALGYVWPGLLVEGAALMAGLLTVLVQRIRLGLWKTADDALCELLTEARARAFRVMWAVAIAVMLLGMVLDGGNMFLYQLPGLLIAQMHNSLRSQCVQNGWYHGLTRKPRSGLALILELLAIFAGITTLVLGLGWLVTGTLPDAWEIGLTAMLAAYCAASRVHWAHMAYRDSNRAADEVVKGAEWSERLYE